MSYRARPHLLGRATPGVAWLHLRIFVSIWMLSLGLGKAAVAMYSLPDVQYVPTERLIANLTRALEELPPTFGQLEPGDEVVLIVEARGVSARASANRAAGPSGNYTVGDDGFIRLSDGQRVLVGGRSAEEAQQLVREMFGHGPDSPKVWLGQTREQGGARPLPHEAAQQHYQLARVHSIAAFLDLQNFPTWADGGWPYFGISEDTDRYDLPSRLRRGAVAPATQQARDEHLDLALEHYRKAVALNPGDLFSMLGAAWVIAQRGDEAETRRAYRETFALAEERAPNGACAAELADALLPLLDPVEDAQEIERLREYREAAERAPRLMTPILIPVGDDDALELLVDRDSDVRFDLDGSGSKLRWGWITRGAAWLVYDPARTGEITSGLQLLGSATFWVFWQDGYAALASLDDDGNGELRGQELEGLALWHDRDLDGLSDPDEVTPLAETEIRALSTNSTLHRSGIPFNPRGVELHDGRIRPSYDWIGTTETAPLSTERTGPHTVGGRR